MFVWNVKHFIKSNKVEAMSVALELNEKRCPTASVTSSNEPSFLNTLYRIAFLNHFFGSLKTCN